MAYRDFSSSGEVIPPARNIATDAPESLRNELVDLAFSLGMESGRDEMQIHRVITLSIGEKPSGQPYGGYRYVASRDLGRADWIRVYDLIPRLGHEFRRVKRFEQFRAAVNRILAANRVVWDLSDAGTLIRTLPQEAIISLSRAMAELNTPRFESALRLLEGAIEAYNGRPQRPRDACANAFDAMEAVGKTVLDLAAATFDDVLKEIARRNALAAEITQVLSRLNIVRHNHFGHGMTKPFALSPPEVDFVYLGCVAACILLARGFATDLPNFTFHRTASSRCSVAAGERARYTYLTSFERRYRCRP